MPECYWNGEPARAHKVWVTVPDSDAHPVYWARAEGIIGQRIAAVEVDYFPDHLMYLDDRNGSGWNKVTFGYGSPAWGHSNIAGVLPELVEPREAEGEGDA